MTHPAQSAGLEKMMLGSIVQLTDTGVRQEIDFLGQVTTRFFNAVHAQADEAIRAKLIELGWTPPGAALAKPPTNAAGLEQRARELLAAEYKAAGRVYLGDAIAIRAIVAALTAAPAALYTHPTPSAVEALAKAAKVALDAPAMLPADWVSLKNALAHPEIAALLKEKES